MIFHMNKLYVGTIIFDPVTLTFGHYLKLNLANYFRTVSARTLIFQMSVSCDKILPWVHYFLPCDLDLEVWPIF